MIVGCGAWSAPLLTFCRVRFWAQRHRVWSFTFYLLALFFNYPHFMATVYRAYHYLRRVHEILVFTVYIAVFLALAGVHRSSLEPTPSLDFHALHLLEPLALHRPKLWLLMMFARRGGPFPYRE